MDKRRFPEAFAQVFPRPMSTEYGFGSRGSEKDVGHGVERDEVKRSVAACSTIIVLLEGKVKSDIDGKFILILVDTVEI